MRSKRLLKKLLPPLMVDLCRRALIRRANWEVVPAFESTSAGWNVEDVALVYQRKWPDFLRHVHSGEPLGIPPDAIRSEGFDLAFHNTVMCFAHALAVAAAGRSRLSMLDWGCALGHYRIYAQRLMPGLDLDYTGRDLAPMVAAAQAVQSNVTFYDSDICLDRTYDLVMASTSLQYAKDWHNLVANLVRASAGWIYVTGLPVVSSAATFPFVQRAQGYGYNTEYVAWCLNRAEFLGAMETAGARLRQEYVLGYRPSIKGAREQCEYRGYLFQAK